MTVPQLEGLQIEVTAEGTGAETKRGKQKALPPTLPFPPPLKKVDH